jgi:hypothetical protein
MLVAASVMCALLAADDVAITLSEPPRRITSLFGSLRDDMRTRQECDGLLSDLHTRPYLVAVMLGADPPKGVRVNEVFRDFYWTRDRRRLTRWVEAGRYDLVAEAAVVAGRASPDLADDAWREFKGLPVSVVADRVPALLKSKKLLETEEERETFDEFEKAISKRLLGKYTLETHRPQFKPQYSQPALRFGNPAAGPHVFARGYSVGALADRIEISDGGTIEGGLYIAAERFWYRPVPGVGPEVSDCLIVSNGPVSLPSDRGLSELAQVVVIADGDVTYDSGQCYQSLVIARGSITVAGKIKNAQSVLIAGNKITAGKAGSTNTGVLLAKNGIELADDADGKKAGGFRLAGVGPADVGVRWFELADVGLTVGEDGVVTAVAENSPFRGRLEAKDVLKSVNGTKVETADEVRRALRRAVVLGYAVVESVRAGERRSELVPVPDVVGGK